MVCFTALSAIANPVLAQSAGQKAQIAIKVGETQQDVNRASNDLVAKIHTHSLQGKQAATLYVRNIPVFTFLSDQPVAENDVKFGSTQNNSYRAASYKSDSGAAFQSSPQAFNAPSTDSSLTRAAEIATKINQFYNAGVSAETVQVAWKPLKAGDTQGQYVVEMNGTAIAAIDAATTFAQTTRNPEQDALQVANRLRRLLGNAKPLTAAQGKPVAVARRSEPETGEYAVSNVLNGWASWYGPGFDGNLTANGERFNQNAMTAAHKHLPFGTRLRVTNKDTGRSVIVRINDRGPYAGDRILDLSAGAAEQIGLDVSGVAPIKAEVLEAVAGNLAGR
ncbi:MAG: septal ring lytic transglycosylase RlpA family protein [Alkalinema sp. RU_4_3]|nr:septal ring lytic transglycosylase RlpA family protein [Alkalinema sp. RU_4_3]